MVKSLPVEVTAELSKAVKHIQHLFTVGFLSGTIRWTDSRENLYYDGHWFEAKGITFDNAGMTLTSKVDTISLNICNVKKALSDRALSENIKGRPITIQRVYLDAHLAVIGAPVTLFVGFLDSMKIDRKRGKIDVYNHFIKWKMQSPKRQHNIQCPWSFKSTECGFSGVVIRNAESDTLAEWLRTHWAFNYKNIDDYLTDLTVGGTFTADSDDGVGNVAANAFDDNSSSEWISNSVTPHWIQCQFAAAKRITQYSVHAITESHAPRCWVLRGSNNGTTWYDLDIRMGVSWETGGALTKRTFDVHLPDDYIYYRIYIINIVGNDPVAAIAEIELIGDPDQNNDVDFNYTTDAAAKTDIFPYPETPIATDAENISVIVVVRAKQITASARNVAGKIRISGVDYAATAISPATSFTDYNFIWTVNPVTGAAWRPEEFSEADDLCEGGTATASTEISGDEAGKAFDDNTGTKWRSADGMPQWIKYQLAVAKVIVKYTIKAWSNNGLPQNFTFYGSNNDTDWTLLDTRTGITWSADEKKSFAFANTTAYLYYKLNITAVTNGAYAAAVEIELLDAMRLEGYGYTTPADAGAHEVHVSKCYPKITFDADNCDNTYERCLLLQNTPNYGGFIYMGELAVKEFWWGASQKVFTGPY